MSSSTLPARRSSALLSESEFRTTSVGGGTLGREGLLSYHATEYSMAPAMTIGSSGGYDREEVILSTKRQVERLLTLRQPGWDSYGALPINPNAVERASRFVLGLVEHQVAAPRLTPLADGGVRLEWESSDVELHVDIPARDEPCAYFADDGSGVEWEGAWIDAPDHVIDALLQMR